MNSGPIPVPAGDATDPSPVTDTRKLTYSTLAISLGFAGVGAAWAAASSRFGFPVAIGEVSYAISGLWWATVVIARIPLTRHRIRHLLDDLRHPVTGPFPSYVPVIALLLTSHYAAYLSAPIVQVLAGLWTTVLAIVAARLLAAWLSGALRLDQVHPGYALPVIAGPYITSIALMTAGYPVFAAAALGVGTLCWLLIGSLIFVRLIGFGPLPAPLRPTLAVLVAPPVTAGLAWFSMHEGRVDLVQEALLGMMVFLVLTLLFLLPGILSSGFTIAFWAFSFPVGALTAYSIRWSAAFPNTFTTVVAVTMLSLSSLLVVALTVGTLRTRKAVASSRP